MGRWLSVVVLAGWLAVSGLTAAPARAQVKIGMQDSVVMCVQVTGEEDDNTGYLIGFRGAAEFGVLLPTEAMVTLYSPKGVPVAAKIHHVLPDAQSGGYRRAGIVGAAYTTWDVAQNPPCGEQASALLGDDMRRSMPFPVTANQAILIERSGDGSGLDSLPLVGAMALHFVTPEPVALTDMQLIQIDAAPIDMFFPFMPEYSRLALIANKDVSLEVCYALAENSPCTRPQLVNERRVFVEDLAREQPPLDLYGLMRAASVRLYPAWGLVLEYPVNGVIRFSLADSPARREPAFEVGQYVRPLELEGIIVHFYINRLGTPDLIRGDLDGQTVGVPVVKVDDRGQLVIRLSGERRVVEAWLVEVVDIGE